MINKKITAVVTAATMLLSQGALAKTMELTIDSDVVNVLDNEEPIIYLDSVPVIKNDRTLVPLRSVSEGFGMDVEWDEETKTVTVKNEEKTIKLTIGNTAVSVNGEQVEIDVPAEIINDRTMIPVRFVSEQLGYYVSYVDLTKQVLISDKKPVLKVGNKSFLYDTLKMLCMQNLSKEGEEGAKPSEEEIKSVVSDLINQMQTLMILAEAAEKSGSTISEEDKKGIIDLADMLSNGNDCKMSGLFVDLICTNILCNNYLEEKMKFSDDEIKDYYEQNYVKAKHIFFFTVNKYTNEPLSDNEKAAQKKKAEDVLARIKNGADFDEMMKEYSEDSGLESYPDGYVFTKGEMYKVFEDTVYALKEGDLNESIVESESGYHIIKRVPLPELDSTVKNQINSSLFNMNFPNLFNSVIGTVPIEEGMTVDEITAAIFEEI